jgi:hypothetical protein
MEDCPSTLVLKYYVSGDLSKFEDFGTFNSTTPLDRVIVLEMNIFFLETFMRKY